jgi:hypothetical protein
MAKYKTWDPFQCGESPEHSRTFEADDAPMAAELYAERAYSGGEHFDKLDLLVRDEEDGTIYECTVEVEFDPSFACRAYAIKAAT